MTASQEFLLNSSLIPQVIYSSIIVLNTTYILVTSKFLSSVWTSPVNSELGDFLYYLASPFEFISSLSLTGPKLDSFICKSSPPPGVPILNEWHL